MAYEQPHKIHSSQVSSMISQEKKSVSLKRNLCKHVNFKWGRVINCLLNYIAAGINRAKHDNLETPTLNQLFSFLKQTDFHTLHHCISRGFLAIDRSEGEPGEAAIVCKYNVPEIKFGGRWDVVMKWYIFMEENVN